jgi:hypothetical protein
MGTLNSTKVSVSATVDVDVGSGGSDVLDGVDVCDGIAVDVAVLVGIGVLVTVTVLLGLMVRVWVSIGGEGALRVMLIAGELQLAIRPQPKITKKMYLDKEF